MSAGSGGERDKGGRVTRSSVDVPLVEPGVKQCVFCGQLRRKVPNSTTKQNTSQLLTEDAEKTLKRAADIRQDDKIRVATSGIGSLIAREVHYHRYCYNGYTREISLQRILTSRASSKVEPVSKSSTDPDEGKAQTDVTC